MNEFKTVGSTELESKKGHILLNDILHLGDLKHVKVRFNIKIEVEGQKKSRWAIEYFTDKTEDSMNILMKAHYWNGKKRNYQVGDITLAFVEMPSRPDCWLLVHVGEVTKDLEVLTEMGYEYKELDDYNKYIGRLVIRYKNKSQNLVRKAKTTLPQCEVVEILPVKCDVESFPGYDKVNVSWSQLSYLITTESWRTALGNQKGVYLLTDIETGKRYVGSAYGSDMLLGRWENYIDTCHGGNKLLKKLGEKYIRENFRFSILETFNSNTPDNAIIDRENYWKVMLLTRGEFGYNDN